MAEQQQAYRCEACGIFAYTLEALLMHNCRNTIGELNINSFVSPTFKYLFVLNQ